MQMDEINKSIGKNIGILCRQLNIYLNHALSSYDVTASEIMYLGSLYMHDGVTQDELADEFCVDKAAVTRTLGALESKGLIYRTNAEADKRSKRVFLKESAMQYKEALFDIQNQWFQNAFSEFDEETIRAFAKTLTVISDNTRKMNE